MTTPHIISKQALTRAVGVLALSLTVARAQYVEIDLGTNLNSNLQTYDNGGNYPKGGCELNVQGVPFALAMRNNNTNTTGVILTPSDGKTHAFTFTVPPGTYATAIYTLANTQYGQAGVNEGSIVVTGTMGETATLNLKERFNIRDHNNANYVNVVTNPTVVPTYFVKGAANSTNGQVRLDRQIIVLPASFTGDTLASITFNGIGHGYPNGLPFLAGLTVQTTGPSLCINGGPTNSLLVSWSSAWEAWNLEENTNLAATNWTASAETISDDGTNRTIVAQPLAGSRFFRLSH